MELITTLYDKPQYFSEWLRSVRAVGFSRIIVGVDGVKDTLMRIAPLCQNIAEVYYAVKHVGIPVMLNSIVALSNDNYVVKVDADDIVRSDAIDAINDSLNKADEASVTLFRCRNFGVSGMKIGGVGEESYPSAGIYNTQDILGLGGFSALMPTLSDTDYLYRLRAVGKHIKKTTDVIVDRRLHGYNFSELSESKYAEQQYLNKALYLYNSSNSKIPLITTDLKRIV